MEVGASRVATSRMRATVAAASAGATTTVLTRAASGSMFIASDIGPDPEKPFASMIATRLPSL
jgi:hypothetical protein